MNVRPSFGHASRVAAIRAFRAEGKTEREIAKLMGIQPNSVTSMEARARKRAQDDARGPRTITLPASLWDTLEYVAVNRGTQPATLAKKLIEAVLRDSLVDAVLDAGE